MNLKARALALISGLVLALPSSAQVNRCVGPDGKIEFSNAPCAAGSSGGQVRVKPNTLNTSGSREQALKAENERLREQIGNAQRSGQQQQPVQAQAQAAQHQAGSAGGPGPRCSNAMSTYDMAATTRIKPNLIDMEMARKAAEEACGKRVPKMREQLVAEDEEEKRRLRAAVDAFCTANRADERCRR